jgi:hypothetical protein
MCSYQVCHRTPKNVDIIPSDNSVSQTLVTGCPKKRNFKHYIPCIMYAILFPDRLILEDKVVVY